MPRDPQRLRHEIAVESAVLATHGWMRGTAGNVSAVLAPEPLRLVVTASGLDKGDLALDDIVEVDHVGALIQETSHAPSAESQIHARIAGLTGAGAVVHVHNVASVLAGDLFPQGVTLSEIEMLKGIGRPAHDIETTIPVIRNSQDMLQLGNWFEDAFNPEVPAVIVAGHGLYVWGKTVRQARQFTEAADWLLELAVARKR